MKAVHESLLDSLDAAEHARKELEDRLKVVMVQSNRDQRQLKCVFMGQTLANLSLCLTVRTGCSVSESESWPSLVSMRTTHPAQRSQLLYHDDMICQCEELLLLVLCRGTEQLLHDAERNAEVLVLKLEEATGGRPFKLPPRRPHPQQQENGAGAVIDANEIITETLVDFTSVQVRLGSGMANFSQQPAVVAGISNLCKHLGRMGHVSIADEAPIKRDGGQYPQWRQGCRFSAAVTVSLAYGLPIRYRAPHAQQHMLYPFTWLAGTVPAIPPAQGGPAGHVSRSGQQDRGAPGRCAAGAGCAVFTSAF